MPHYTIHLEGIQVVRPSSIVRQMVRHAFEPLVERAGYELNLVDVSLGAEPGVVPDVSLVFRMNRDVLNPRRRILAEQSGTVLVGSILDMRATGEPTRSCVRRSDSRDPLRGSALECTVDPAARTRPLFRNGEPALARTVGNIGVHELGQTTGNLDHHPDPVNHMFTGAAIDRVFGRGFRTRSNLRELWSGWHRFNAAQQRRLVDAIRARELRGVQLTSPAP